MIQPLRITARAALLPALVGLLVSLCPGGAAWAQGDVPANVTQDIARLASLDSQQNAAAVADIKKTGVVAARAVADALVHDPHLAPQTRSNLASALDQLGADGQAALPNLAQAAVADGDPNVRALAAGAFQDICGAIKMGAAPEVPRLRHMLTATQDEDDAPVRGSAAQALGALGAAARAAVPDLTAALKDPDENVCNSAAGALGSIAGGLQTQAHQMTAADLAKTIAGLTAAEKGMEGPNTHITDPTVKPPLHVALAAMRLELESKQQSLVYRATRWALGHKAITGGALYVLCCLSFCLLLLAVRPLWILRINDWLQPYTDISLPSFLGGVKVPARTVLLVGFFHYHPRVLDAWVAAHAAKARREFVKKDTVRDRRVCVPIPVVLDDATVASLGGPDLRPTFSQARGCLLITGEGGAGKTTMACQVAGWALAEDKSQRLCDHLMLPVLIEHEIDFKVAAGKDPLKEAICGQLQFLIEEAETIPDELLERLLRQRRVLVIVDHFSEMSEATRQQIRPAAPEFPVNALIVTSRLQEEMDGMPQTALKPLRIEGNRLSSFMEAYLTRRGKRALFEDTEYFDACRRLSLMVGQRKITVLLAKLFAEQMIAAKEGTGDGYLPDNVPDLMLSYLNELNRGAGANDLDNRAVQADAKVIAWECLKLSFRPAPARRDEVLAAVGDNAEVHLKYLERRLRLLQTVPPAEDQIRFALDPLAESLAALHLVETFGKKEAPWRKFLVQAESMPGGPEAIRGFLLAVRDCCLAKGRPIKVPAFVTEKLDALTGLAPAPVTPPPPAPVPGEEHVVTVAPDQTVTVAPDAVHV